MIRYPDGNVILRNLNRDFPIIDYGKGLYLFDTNGKKYIDASGGALVTSLGHGHPKMAQSIYEQLQKVAYVNGTQFTSQATEELAERLCEKSKKIGLDRASFLSSGSEAIEAAIKFVRQLWVERDKPERRKIIARVPSYHGNTLFALSISGRPHYKKYYGPYLNEKEVCITSAPYSYRSEVENYESNGAKHYAKLLEELIEKEGAESIAAFIFEPIIGSSAAGAVPPEGYFDEVTKICKKNGILLIADEILCGSGRTGAFFACEHFNLNPDVLLLGKGISGGYVALSVLLTKDEYIREMKKNTGYFMHAQTYMQAPSMTAAGLAALKVFEEENLISNANQVGEYFHQKMKDRFLSHPSVGHIDGKGLLLGVEFVKDKKTKTPFTREDKWVENFTSKAFQNGLIVWPNVGHIDGKSGDLIVMGPPLNIKKSQIDEIVEAFEKILT